MRKYNLRLLKCNLVAIKENKAIMRIIKLDEEIDYQVQVRVVRVVIQKKINSY